MSTRAEVLLIALATLVLASIPGWASWASGAGEVSAWWGVTIGAGSVMASHS